MTTPIHGRSRAAVLLSACLAACLLGCVARMDRVLDMGEAAGTDDVAEALQDLPRIALSPDESEPVRIAALTALARLDRAAAVPPALLLADGYGGRQLGLTAIWLLGRTDDPDAVGPLAGLVTGGAGLEPTLRALEGLALLTHHGADSVEHRQAILRAANVAETRFPESDIVRHYAALLRTGLAQPQDYVVVLREALVADDVRGAHNALGWLGRHLIDGPEGSRAVRAEAVDELAVLTSHPDPALRLRALWFLGRIRERSTAIALLSLARYAPDRPTRLMSLWALSRTDPRMFRDEFPPMPADLLDVTPANWKLAHEYAMRLGEPDLEIQRFIADVQAGEGER